jgi:hypothetical protein
MLDGLPGVENWKKHLVIGNSLAYLPCPSWPLWKNPKANMAGTLERLKIWGANAMFPAHDFTNGAQSFNDATIGGVFMSLRKMDHKNLTGNMVVHRLGVK